ncbi:m057L [Myxoma virus]|uniref:M057L n=2 Tax=Myxoma virus TaxID=10273 RepID=Q9Q8N9_MYXVL|nr:m057L [Myxoma virus]ACB28851.1 m057L [recombinant virus 6918VP60-T2]AAF14945.1 m057L [Myxoma virus]ACB28680.1 m057L [Myxoma virus]AFU77658.1 m057L [Myxoma virus]AFU78327.1 m057L [Myxoma virus]
MKANNRYQDKHYEKNATDKPRKEHNEPVKTCGYDDFITQRLNLHERESRDLECNAAVVNCMLKQAGKEETECWIELSSLVRYRKALGFPLLRGYKQFSYGKMLYFEQFKHATVEKLTPQTLNVTEAILFQIVVILYSMYKKEIYADEFVFELVTIPRSTFHISINQLVFDVCTDKLVVLSLCTRPYKAKLPQSCYLNYIHWFNTTAKKSYETSNYFFEWLIKNHLRYLHKDGVDLFKIRKRTVSGPRINRFVDPGTIVLVARDDMFVAGITLTNVSISDNVRILFSLDGGSILEIDDFSIYDVYSHGEFFIRSQLTSILI